MFNLAGKKQRVTQYAAGGAVAVVILFAWISIPLMHNSSLDSSANPNSFFKTRTADVNSLASDIPLEGGAPGYSLNGRMLNNPVTSGEDIAATLFQTGPLEEGIPADSPAGDLSSDIPMPEAPAAGSAGSAGVPGAGRTSKLSVLPSIGAGNSNTMTIGGGTHNKFFGSGSGAKKEEVLDTAAKKPARPGITGDHKRNALVEGLKKMNDRSVSAAGAFGADQSRSGATSAFNGNVQSRTASLDTRMETASTGAGISLGAAAQDLKSNDPSMSSKSITIPEPEVDKDAEADEEMKKMILQMLMSSLLGGIFSEN